MRNILIALLCVLPSFAFCATRATKPADLAQFIDQHAAEHDFSGTILVRDQGKTIYSHSFGLANRAFSVPNTELTRYKIASITKTFTATLILQLVDEDLLDLQQPIRTYLPDYPNPGGEQITVHQLLNHTSGLSNFDTVKDFSEALAQGLPVYQKPYSSDQLLQQLCSQPPLHKAGTRFDYNNGDYIILGKIIEKLRGKAYEEVLRERILDPLKMTNSGMLRQQDVVPLLADTYFLRPDIGVIVPDLPVYPENWYAAGSMYSSVDDLAIFAEALFSENAKLIKPASMALMLKPGLDDYGYGGWTYESTIAGKKHAIYKRPGSIMGAQAQFYQIMDADITVVILSNVGNNDLDQFVAQIGKRAVN